MIINSGSQENKGGYALLNVTVTGGSQGDTVTASKTGTTYTGTLDANSQCSILIYEPGTYGVSYEGGSPTNIDIGFGGATYSVTLEAVTTMTLVISDAPVEQGAQGYDKVNWRYGAPGDPSAQVYQSPYNAIIDTSANSTLTVQRNDSASVGVLLNGSYAGYATLNTPSSIDLSSYNIHFLNQSGQTTLTVNPGDVVYLELQGVL